MKKKIVYILALLTSISCNVSCLSQQKDNVKVDNKVDNNKSFGRKDPSWIKLSTVWKDITKLDENKDFAVKTKIYDKVMKEYTEIDKYLKDLETKGILSKRQKDFIKQQFDVRYYSLPQRTGMVTCYEASIDGFKIQKTVDELNKQYEILDKLAQDGKINSQTYINAKNNIIQDIKDCKAAQKKEMIIPDDSLVELLYFLSK